MQTETMPESMPNAKHIRQEVSLCEVLLPASLSLRQEMSASLSPSLIIHHPLSHHTSHSATEQHPSHPFINTSSALGATHPLAGMVCVQCVLCQPHLGGRSTRSRR